MLGSKRADRSILGVLGSFLEALHITFVHLDHVLDKLLVEFAARLLGELTIGAILFGIFLIEVNLPLARHAGERAVHLGVILDEALREALDLGVSRLLRRELGQAQLGRGGLGRLRYKTPIHKPEFAAAHITARRRRCSPGGVSRTAGTCGC